MTFPSGIGLFGVIVTWPESSVVPEPIILPSLSNKSTWVCGSVVTSIGVKVWALPIKSVFTVGVVGEVMSVALTGVDVELLGCSASSVALAVTFPSGISCVGVIITWPFEAVVPEPMIRPFLSNKSTCVFGSVETSTDVFVVALPVKFVLILGFAGGVVSVAFSGADVDTLLDGSYALAMIFPSKSGSVGVIVTWPLESVVPLPIIFPVLSTNSTRVSGSVITVIDVIVVALPIKLVLIIGTVGGIVSVIGTWSESIELGISAPSVALANILPNGNGYLGVIIAWPVISVINKP